MLGPPSDPPLDGLSKAVFGLVLPETRAITRQLWLEQPELLYERAYDESQDYAHVVLFERWRAWVSAHVTGLSDYRHTYATNGSSEAIRESIWSLAKAAQDANRTAYLHVFTGEYEGYAAYARAAGVDVVAHDRAAWNDVTYVPNALHRWYVSQPSAIDGNVWGGFQEFLRAMAERDIEVAVDLAYVGATDRPLAIDISLPNVPHVFFSLSKVFGVFYNRVGGVFSRTPMLGLEGNKWFKNLFSLYLGVSLIDAMPTPATLPAKYRPVQIEACEILSARHDIPLAPSDVILLATSPPGAYPDGFRRGAGYRWCLTPTMDALLRAHAEEVPADA